MLGLAMEANGSIGEVTAFEAFAGLVVATGLEVGARVGESGGTSTSSTASPGYFLPMTSKSEACLASTGSCWKKQSRRLQPPTSSSYLQRVLAALARIWAASRSSRTSIS